MSTTVDGRGRWYSVVPQVESLGPARSGPASKFQSPPRPFITFLLYSTVFLRYYNELTET